MWAAAAATLALAAPANACEPVRFGPAEEQNIACKCSARACNARLEFAWPPDDLGLLEMRSTRAGARFQLRNISLLAQDQVGGHAERLVFVDVARRKQRVLGYGGALTDSASMLIATKLDERTRAHLMEAYFGPSGLNYNMARVPIGGTDMSWRAYSLDDLDLVRRRQRQEPAHDFDLAHFRLAPEDLKFKLPLIRQARELRRNGTRSGELRLLAASWSAPNWMKSNEELVQGRLKEDEAGRYYDAYARYLIRFMDEYERELGDGARIWALTPQNEPCTPGRLGRQVVNYNSLNFNPRQMGQFVRRHLVPSLLAANRTARDLALFVWDDTLLGLDQYKGHLFPPNERQQNSSSSSSSSLISPVDEQQRAQQAAAEDYVRGLALHWYSQALDKLPYGSLHDLRNWLPAQYAWLSTEASFIGRPRPGEWARAERYARDLIESLRAGSVAWIDWNLALNMAGGPTWSGNFLDAAILIDDRPPPPAELGQELRSEFYKNPMFFAMGHLSRFVRARSHVLASQLLAYDAQRASWRPISELGGGSAPATSELLAVAAELDEPPERLAEGAQATSKWRQVALVLLNRADRKLRVDLQLANCNSRLGAQPIGLELEAKSITSYALNC